MLLCLTVFPPSVNTKHSFLLPLSLSLQAHGALAKSLKAKYPHGLHPAVLSDEDAAAVLGPRRQGSSGPAGYWDLIAKAAEDESVLPTRLGKVLAARLYDGAPSMEVVQGAGEEVEEDLFLRVIGTSPSLSLNCSRPQLFAL